MRTCSDCGNIIDSQAHVCCGGYRCYQCWSKHSSAGLCFRSVGHEQLGQFLRVSYDPSWGTAGYVLALCLECGKPVAKSATEEGFLDVHHTICMEPYVSVCLHADCYDKWMSYMDVAGRDIHVRREILAEVRAK